MERETFTLQELRGKYGDEARSKKCFYDFVDFQSIRHHQYLRTFENWDLLVTIDGGWYAARLFNHKKSVWCQQSGAPWVVDEAINHLRLIDWSDYLGLTGITEPVATEPLNIELGVFPPTIDLSLVRLQNSHRLSNPTAGRAWFFNGEFCVVRVHQLPTEDWLVDLFWTWEPKAFYDRFWGTQALAFIKLQEFLLDNQSRGFAADLVHRKLQGNTAPGAPTAWERLLSV